MLPSRFTFDSQLRFCIDTTNMTVPNTQAIILITGANTGLGETLSYSPIGCKNALLSVVFDRVRDGKGAFLSSRTLPHLNWMSRRFVSGPGRHYSIEEHFAFQHFHSRAAFRRYHVGRVYRRGLQTCRAKAWPRRRAGQ